MKQKALIIVIVILALALATFWYVNRSAQAPTVNSTNSSSNNSDTPSNETPVDSNTPGAVGKNTVAVTGQKAGSSVIIDQLNLSDDGFVVIYENNNGQLGKVVGNSKLIGAGTKLDLVVNVTTKPGASYLVALHTDNGDGKFNASQDTLVKDAQGKTVSSLFTAAK